MNAKAAYSQKILAFLSGPNQWIWATLSLLAVVSVRFNRNNLFFKRPLDDAEHYINLVKYFRGLFPADGLLPPFNERFFTPLLASGLPLEPMTAINVLNTIYLLGGLYFLRKIAREFDLSETAAWVATYLFILSFPTFYYATIGYLDSGVIFFSLMGWWAVTQKRWGLWLLALLCGTCTKEAMVYIVPVVGVWVYHFHSRRAGWLLGVGSVILFVLIWKLIKMNVPSGTMQPTLYWQPEYAFTVYNLSRSSFWISSLLSLGLPAAAVFRQWRRLSTLLHSPQVQVLLAGVAAGAGLWLYALSSAYVDGRFLWVSSPCWILLTLYLYEKREPVGSLENNN